MRYGWHVMMPCNGGVIAEHPFSLAPGRFAGAEDQEEDGEPFAEKFPRMRRCWKSASRRIIV